MNEIKSLISQSYKKPNIDHLLGFKLNIELTKNNSVIDYLKIRKNLSDETIKHFDLGYDVYRDNITIPETKNGEVVNVAYLSLNKIDDKEAKDKYTKENGCENWIFNEDGLNTAKKKGKILVVSNQFDAMSAYQAGVEMVVSVPVGKIATGMWMELFDNIPNIYICFENNKVSKKYAYDFADRVGIDKCFEINLPEDSKDLNEYFKSHNIDEFRELWKVAKPYYSYNFKGLSDVIDLMRDKKENTYKFKCIPYVEFEEDWLVVLTGASNMGKTSLVLNIANELSINNIPSLILPFERGIKTVGKRFLQVMTDKKQSELDEFSGGDLDELVKDVKEKPIYFSVPTIDQLKDTISRAKKLFGIKVVLIDHLDYLVRKSSDNYNVATATTLQQLKSLAQEFNILFIVVHHTKKPEGTLTQTRRLKMEDLKGSSSLYQDPEAVIMIQPSEKDQMDIEILKNKGEMGSMIYNFNSMTGRVGLPIELTPEIMTPEQQTQKNFENF